MSHKKNSRWAALVAGVGASTLHGVAAARYNLQDPVTKTAAEIYELHSLMFWICVAIFVIVFGIMFYSVFAHRKSVGHKASQFHENTTVEVVWTVIPLLILIVMAWPATKP